MSTVLIVDDNEDILVSISGLLRLVGFDTLVARGSLETYAHLQNTLPDIVLLDVRLLGESGVTICESLKAEERTRHIPVVMMSAHPDGFEASQEAGADGFLQKPLSLKQLKSAIDEKLKQL